MIRVSLSWSEIKVYNLLFYENGLEAQESVSTYFKISPAHNMYRFFTYLSYILGTGFGSGYAPAAPGTVGSVAAALFWIICAGYLPPIGTSAEIILIVFSIFVAVAVTNHCLSAGPLAQEKDPQQIVVDEWAGLFVSFALLTPKNVVPLIVAFVLFRLFDGWKPGVIDWAQGLPRGYGVVADDILAGLTARIIVFFIWGL